MSFRGTNVSVLSFKAFFVVFSLTSVWWGAGKSVAQESNHIAGLQPFFAIYLEVQPEPGGNKVALGFQSSLFYKGGDVIPISVSLDSADSYERCKVIMTVRQLPLGEDIYSADTLIDLIPGHQTISFEFDTQDIVPGEYVLEAGVYHTVSRCLAKRMINIKVLASNEVKQFMEDVSRQLNDLLTYLDQVSQDSPSQKHAVRYRLEPARFALQEANCAYANEHLFFVDTLSRYALKIVNQVRSELTFGGGSMQSLFLTAPATETELDKFPAPTEGGFLVGGEPCFLVGIAPTFLYSEFPWEHYGLNLFLLTENLSEAVSPPRERLRNFSQTLPHIIYFPTLDVGKAKTQLDLDEVKKVCNSPFVAEKISQIQPFAIGLLDQPHFQFLGEEVRQKFIAHLRNIYPTVDALNSVWRSRLLNFDEVIFAVDVSFSDNQPNYVLHNPYQYDVQTFHQQLGKSYVDLLIQRMRESGVTLPFLVTFADDVFEPKETTKGVDRELIQESVEILGCVTRPRKSKPELSVSHPFPSVTYALLNSLSPAKPIVDCDLAAVLPTKLYDDTRPKQIYTFLWNSLIAGADAVVVHPYAEDALEDLRDHIIYKTVLVETWDVARSVCLDVNRLAREIRALQSAPAEVGILWSMPTKISENAENFLKTAAHAYEAVSYFGLPMRFITESQCASGQLFSVSILLIPDISNVTEETFAAVQHFVESGRPVIRLGRTMNYNERGIPRRDVLASNSATVFVPTEGLPTHYLNALDFIYHECQFPLRPRSINEYGYPLEGVINRSVRLDDGSYLLYLVNIRRSSVRVFLEGGEKTGVDLIAGRDVHFPMVLEPCEPLLIRFNETEYPSFSSSDEAGAKQEKVTQVIPIKRIQKDSPAAGRSTSSRHLRK